MKMKNWNIGALLNLSRKLGIKTDPKQPTQRCYSCGKPARSGFTICDACYYKDPKVVK